MSTIAIGTKVYLRIEEIKYIYDYDSRVAKKSMDMASKAGKLVDFTRGKKRRCVIESKDGDVILCCIHAETVAARIDQKCKEILRQANEEAAQLKTELTGGDSK